MTRDVLFTTNPADITKLASDIMLQAEGAASGRSTYLRSLLAATQSELAGKPVQRVQGRAKRVDLDLAVQTYEKVQESFYAAVLAAVPAGLNAQERQSKTSFARSAGATLRRAIRAGWNPLGTALHAVTKAGLAAWTADHSEPRNVSAKGAEKRLASYVDRIDEILARLPKEDAERLKTMVLEQLGTPVQRIVSSTVKRHEARAH